MIKSATMTADGHLAMDVTETQTTAKTIYKRRQGPSLASKIRPYLMVTPAMTILTVFVIYPIIYMIYLSFFKWNLVGNMTFVGLENFTNMLANEDFWMVMKNTFQYTIFNVSLSMVCALALAVYLHTQKGVIGSIMQGVIFTPYVVSLVSISFIWMWLMDTDYGLLNYVLGLFGIDAIGWLSDPSIAMFSLILVTVWKGLGYNAIILLSGMQSIPPYLYEAAKLDQAKGWTTFWKITLPMLSPTLFFLALMNMISSFKVFETISIMTGGGPMDSTNTLVFNIYQYGFKFYKIGYASALGVVLMLIIGVCTLLYFYALSKKVHYR